VVTLHNENVHILLNCRTFFTNRNVIGQKASSYWTPPSKSKIPLFRLFFSWC